MKLLPEAVKRTIPALYATDGQADNQRMAKVRYFHPFSNWEWFVFEGQPEEGDFLFFGCVVGQEVELGYFTLDQLLSNRFIERDMYFKPQLWARVRANHERSLPSLGQ